MKEFIRAFIGPLAGGFWAVATAIQTPDAPMLRITGDGSHVMISWPHPSPGFRLQEAANLLNSSGWSDVLQAISVVGQENVVRLPATPSHKFYRLMKR